MLKKQITDILLASKESGWVLEPDAKRLLSLAGLMVPKFIWATSLKKAISFAEEIGYPVVAKIVSSHILHKSDVGGVVVGINNDKELTIAFDHLSRLKGFSGVVVEEMLTGVELIAGGKIDYQFGPVILLGIGGTGVEIYQDTTLKMAPLKETDVISMVKGLKASQLIEGYRGSEPVNIKELTHLLMNFSHLVMELEGSIESIDLNPVICFADKCVVADARIMLNAKAIK